MGAYKWSHPAVSANSTSGFEPEYKKKTKDSRGLVKAERMKTLSGTSERLNHSLIKDWMVVGGDKTQ